jgi:hypothetical protein
VQKGVDSPSFNKLLFHCSTSSSGRLEVSFISIFHFFSRICRQKLPRFCCFSCGMMKILGYYNFLGSLMRKIFKIYDRSFREETKNSTQVFEFEHHNGNSSHRIMIVLEAFFMIFPKKRRKAAAQKVFSLSKYFSFVG